MHDAFGVVVFSGNNVHIEGLENYRSLGSISFLGRYRIIDFPMSNLTNSGIETIQLYVNKNPRSIIDHVGTGRHYNINSKRGSLDILFGDGMIASDLYRNDIASFDFNRSAIEKMNQKYVVVTTNFMLFSLDYNKVIAEHIKTGADVTMVYKTVNNAKEEFINCDTLNLNRQKGVLSINRNRGNAKSKHISMESYVMSKEIFLAMIDQAVNTSSLYWMRDILNDAASYLDIRGYQYKGYLAAVYSFNSYYWCNMELLDLEARKQLFNEAWPIYTKTNDSPPTRYVGEGSARNSLVSNGCLIEGSIINSVVGRGCVIKAGAVVENSIIFPGSVIGEDVHVNYVVVDSRAHIAKVKDVSGSKEHAGYVRRDDRI